MQALIRARIKELFEEYKSKFQYPNVGDKCWNSESEQLEEQTKIEHIS